MYLVCFEVLCLRELVSKVEGGCMSACFHMASRARTRAAELQNGSKLGPSEGVVSGTGGILPLSARIWPELDL